VPGPLNSGPGFFTEVLVLRSLFWRILASFWLAIALVAGLSILLGHMLNQDAWILSRHPGLNTLASRWVQHYEQEGLESRNVSLNGASNATRSTCRCSTTVATRGARHFPRRAAAFEARQHNDDAACPGAA
jgi:hypothetical protein